MLVRAHSCTRTERTAGQRPFKRGLSRSKTVLSRQVAGSQCRPVGGTRHDEGVVLRFVERIVCSQTVVAIEIQHALDRSMTV